MLTQSKLPYAIGILVSFVLHLLLAVFTILLLEHRAATASRPPEIFSVTLEGGEKLGGFTQVPKEGAEKTPKAGEEPPAGPEEPEEAAAPEPEPEPVAKKEEPKAEVAKAAPEPEVETKPLEKPSAIKDPEIKKKEEAAKKKAAEEEKKRQEAKKKEEEAKKKKAAEEKKRKDEARKKKEAEEKKKREEEAKKKAAEEKKKREARERRQREKRLQETIAKYRTKSQYQGESANAGGQGFGAARTGGQGMGGGVLASAEKIAYSNLLQQHVKSGWRWLPGAKKLKALVSVRILPNGQVQDIRITTSSGNSKFDDSVVRAVRKASPVPPPPEKFYSEFSSVRFWFDSHEQ